VTDPKLIAVIAAAWWSSDVDDDSREIPESNAEKFNEAIFEGVSQRLAEAAKRVAVVPATFDEMAIVAAAIAGITAAIKCCKGGGQCHQS